MLTSFRSSGRRVKTKIANDGLYYTLIGCVIVANISLFCYGLMYQLQAPAIGLSHYILPLGRACGVTLEFNCALILLPMCHSLLTLLRRIPIFVLIIPFDHLRAIHIFLANLIGIASGIHGILQLINYISASVIESPDIIWTSGFTGAAAVKPIRKRVKFEVFFYSHHLFVVFYLVLLIHGQRGSSFKFWKWFLVPGVLYCLDRIYRLVSIHRSQRRCNAVSLRYFEKSKVIRLEIPKVMDFRTGQYAEIIIPAISMSQRHPFTIASAPEDETMVFYIKKYGRWTSILASMSEKYEERKKDLRVYVGGPFGAPAQFSGHYDHVLLIGTGIGATPFVSAMKHTTFVCGESLQREAERDDVLEWAKDHIQTQESCTENIPNEVELSDCVHDTEDPFIDEIPKHDKSKRKRLYVRIYRTFTSLITYISELWLILFCIQLEAIDRIFFADGIPIYIGTITVLCLVFAIMLVQVVFEIIANGGIKYFYSAKRIISLLDTPAVIVLIICVAIIVGSHRAVPYGVLLLFVSLSLLFILLFVRLTLRIGAKNLLQLPSSTTVEFVRSVEFVWVNSVNEDIEWMLDDLRSLENHTEVCSNDCSLKFYKKLFITREEPIQPDSFTRLTMFRGRPNWPELFNMYVKQLQEKDDGETVIGVFFCGTPVVGDEIRKLCSATTARLSSTISPKYFIFHQEVF